MRSDGRSGSRQRQRRGFTLVEILVVIGIILVILSILIPSVARIRQAAEKKAVQADLQTISMGLDAYKADFGDYPHPPLTNRNYHILSWALIGSGETVDPWGYQAPKPEEYDGAPGWGFRTNWDKVNKTGSKVFGPYVPPEKYQNGPDIYKWDLTDRFGSPIEYFPRWRMPGANVKLFNDGTTVTLNWPPPLPAATTAPPMVTSVYDYHQIMQLPPANPLTAPPSASDPVIDYFRRALGDVNYNDVIDGGETLKEAPPFLLMSWGPLKKKMLTRAVMDKGDLNKCRVITNLPE
jgi:prepilin-type N-terminal cleavage/methylation domain-containing protein